MSETGEAAASPTIDDYRARMPDCCVYTRQQNGRYLRCTRAGLLTLGKELRDQATSKKLPLFGKKKAEQEERLICMFHWRIITEIDATTPEQFYARDLALYEPRDEDIQRFIKEFLPGAVDEWLSDGISPITEDGQPDGDADNLKYLNFARTLARSQKTMTPRPPKLKRTRAEEEDNSEDKQINFDLLSAVAIRRYKKFFKLPNRSGANPKNQLLDGIHDHAESVPVDASGTAAYFLHVLRNKKNRLDHPDVVSL